MIIIIIIIHRPKLFQSSIAVENGLPGVHKRDYTFMTSARKEMVDLGIYQKFVNSTIDFLRNF